MLSADQEDYLMRLLLIREVKVQQIIYIFPVIDSPYQLYIPAEKFKGQDELVVRVANSMANRIAYMDKKGVDWKIFYNVNMSARKKENVKNGIFDASDWEPKSSGLLGPVTLTPAMVKQ